LGFFNICPTLFQLQNTRGCVFFVSCILSPDFFLLMQCSVVAQWGVGRF